MNIDKVDIRKIVLSNKESYCEKGLYKCCIGYIYKGNALPPAL